MTLTEQLPGTTVPDDLYDAFARWVGEQGISLYPAQEEALIEVMTGLLLSAGAYFDGMGRKRLSPPSAMASSISRRRS